jgi:hypothetical protein
METAGMRKLDSSNSHLRVYAGLFFDPMGNSCIIYTHQLEWTLVSSSYHPSSVGPVGNRAKFFLSDLRQNRWYVKKNPEVIRIFVCVMYVSLFFDPLDK